MKSMRDSARVTKSMSSSLTGDAATTRRRPSSGFGSRSLTADPLLRAIVAMLKKDLGISSVNWNAAQVLGQRSGGLGQLIVWSVRFVSWRALRPNSEYRRRWLEKRRSN